MTLPARHFPTVAWLIQAERQGDVQALLRSTSEGVVQQWALHLVPRGCVGAPMKISEAHWATTSERASTPPRRGLVPPRAGQQLAE